MIVPVILSGGSGTRLWPLSRPPLPKQLLPMTGESTMLRMTIDRVEGLPDLAPPVIVCNTDHEHLASSELVASGHDAGRLVLEPIGRNTAPAVAAAAIVIAAEHGAETLMLVLPADHVIDDEEAFRAAVSEGIPHARDGALVTFGIVPTKPETGYGYIRMGAPVTGGSRVDRFVEKPDAETAAVYLAGGDHLWNSGMFLFSAGSYLAELAEHAPDILEAVEASMTPSTEASVRLDADAFGTARSTSIDYAVMEHTKKAVVIPLDAGWSDVGSWSALHEVTSHDDQGNTVVGDVTVIATADSYVRSSGRLVAAVGLERMFVVETPDAVIVGPLDMAQEVKSVVEDLQARGRTEATTATSGRERWGSWRNLDTHRAAAMEIVIEPGATAELDRHYEIVVLAGPVSTVAVEARASLDRGDVAMLTHPRITNTGNEPAVLIVVEIEEAP